MSVISMKQLLEAGVHFGHQTRRWNPKMKPFIFGARNGIYIIDLQRTVKLFRHAYQFVVNRAAAGDTVLFVGTKRQAQDAIREEAQRCGMFYINHRWLGGMLTNFKTIKKGIDRLKELDTMVADGSINRFPKKEILELQRERDSRRSPAEPTPPMVRKRNPSPSKRRMNEPPCWNQQVTIILPSV